MNKKTILIIDDDVDICNLLKRFFERNDFNVKIAFKGLEGLQIIKNEKIDLVLTDFRLPDKDGLEMIEAIKSINTHLPIIVITGYSDVNQAVKVIRLGAFEYVTKPIFPEEILLLVHDALDKLKVESAKLTKSTQSNQKSNDQQIHTTDKGKKDEFLIPASTCATKIQRLISLVAPTNMTVVILGESGTGKEVVARRIHENSDRSSRPFIPVDCGALTQELAASELFGHLKGAFTGATSDKKGSFELANQGTLFLDEIGNLSYENQVKLLRVLQERVIRKVGGEKDLPIDVRIIVATNEDLRIAMSKGTFREDIYYRINEFQIELKPLRENKAELTDFVAFFLHKANLELSKTVKGLDDEVWNIFNSYSWPGNIRELKNIIKLAVLMSDNDMIEKNDLPNDILNPQEWFKHNNQKENSNSSKPKSLILKDVTAEAETQAIIEALSLASNNKTKAADILGIDRKTLYNKLNIYDLLDR
ncbi:sigma-54-dependent transcriptional regulator [Brumimicrobium mesophilum]|uniref:sigma-54-dependent transcriptional regulator n=1 Tax=Brumimicrobium mesophilum TaxID=392717 RepID=UPI000D140AE4|nr:sigma-54 dependent transcriptional regulator [Brumimicrobium mesophilum]